MAYALRHNAVSQYRQVSTHGGVEQASPQRLIAMLVEGAIERVTAAAGHMRRNEIGQKGELISRAIAIVDALRASLDLKTADKLAANLDALYEYMGRRLLQANLENKPAFLDEVVGLLRILKEGWDGIASHAQNSPQVVAVSNE